MALVLADRVKETTTTTGTGTVTLLGAATGYQSFAAVGNANTTYYTIAGQTSSEWEVGIGTYTSSGTTLSRDTVLSSSNSGSLVTFSVGTKDVFVTYPSSRSIYANGAVLTATNSSVLPIANGGTALTTFTANQIHYGSFSQSAGLTFDGTNLATTGTATAAKLIPTGTSVTGNGMYLPATNSVGISTAGVERVRVDASGNTKLITAGTNIQNSSGNPILLQSGSVLKVQQFTDAGSSTSSTSVVNLNASGFGYTPVSTNSTLYLTITAYAYIYPAGGSTTGAYGFYYIGEYNGSTFVTISNAGYLWNYQYNTAYSQSIAAQAYMTVAISNTSLTSRSFDLMGGVSSSTISFTGASIIFTVMEVAN